MVEAVAESPIVKLSEGEKETIFVYKKRELMPINPIIPKTAIVRRVRTRVVGEELVLTGNGRGIMKVRRLNYGI